MASPEKDTAGVPVPPPLLFFICLGAGGLLTFLVPLPLTDGLNLFRFFLASILFVLAGLTAASAFSVMARYKTPFDPAKPTLNIVREGAFRFSRNPMYLALLLTLGSIAIATASLWLFIAWAVLFGLLRQLAVLREEAYLTRKFGDEYLAYMRSVRRWI